MDITPVESEGFSSWERIESLAWGIDRTLGRSMILGAIFDRDFWCDEQIAAILNKLNSRVAFAHIHDRKEIENYLLIPTALDKAIKRALNDRARRGGKVKEELEPAHEILSRLTDPMRNELGGQYVAKRLEFFKRSKRDTATLTTETMHTFDKKWSVLETRLTIVRGKETLQRLRDEVQHRWKVTLTDARIINAFDIHEIPEDISDLLTGLESFRKMEH